MDIWTMQSEQLRLVKEKGFSRDTQDIYKFIAQLHSEVTEFMQVWKKVEDMEEVKRLGAPELADIIIRTAHLANVLDIDLDRAVVAKMKDNFKREFKYGEVR